MTAAAVCALFFAVGWFARGRRDRNRIIAERLRQLDSEGNYGR